MIQTIDLNNTDWRSSREFFEGLADELRALDNRDEAYNFTWVGKRKSIIEAGAPINKTLRPMPADSVNFDTTENLFITGDNLDALKLLQESYLGKVKMIYIDPPYNTGKDFVYGDNFRADNKEYAEASGKKSASGEILVAEDEFKENARSNGRFHSDWLSMMYPRLKLARNLLTDDGVIFISIDDNEQANLKKLCDEVFGEDNCLGTFIVNSTPNARDYGHIGKMHEFVLFYAKSAMQTTTNMLPEQDKSFKYSDEKGGYNIHPLYNSNEAFTNINRPNLYYPFYLYLNESLGNGFYKIGLDKKDNCVTIFPPKSQKNLVQFVWRWGKEKALRFMNEEIIGYITNDGEYRIVQKMRHSEKLIRSILADTKYSSRRGTAEVEELLNGKIFSFPKPLALLYDLTMVATDSNDIVVDLFAGSGTTAHAVMKLNAEDGGNRKFILCQLDEPCNEKSEAFKAGYKTIDEISRERIRRAGDSIKNEKLRIKREEEDDLFAQDDKNLLIDTGFRALKIDNANEKDNIRKPVTEIEQSIIFEDVENLKTDRTPLDLLFGVLCQSALPYQLKIKNLKLREGKNVCLYGYEGEGTGLIACFEDAVSEETVKQIATMKPLTAVFKNSSFADSTASVNLGEHFRLLSPKTKVKVI